ncbi:unnamed protein product [Moneuplotes crassus]|uniref:Uncharacterized protein n=1 Tax=Euplotes crassus TaxID=5936 RepID=A0AAD2DBS3_EUPCR|nr:unnamed protein product [Moneuplotes crassus]
MMNHFLMSRPNLNRQFQDLEIASEERVCMLEVNKLFRFATTIWCTRPNRTNKCLRQPREQKLTQNNCSNNRTLLQQTYTHEESFKKMKV